LLRAAARARERLGFAEAVAFLERALALCDGGDAPAGARELDILLAIGGMRVALGELDTAVRDLDRAAALAAPGWRPSPSERARALRLAALALIEAGDLDAAEKRLDDALREVREEGGAELASVLYHFSQLRWHQSRHRDAYALAERCLAVAEASNDAPAIARGYEMLALACHSLGEWQEGMEHEEKRQALASGALDVASAFDVHL
jgi:tetratricopeptide (TPR) repeat protein